MCLEITGQRQILCLALCKYALLLGIFTELGGNPICFPCLSLCIQGQGRKRSMGRVAFEWGLSDLAREFVFQLGFEDRVKILNEK